MQRLRAPFGLLSLILICAVPLSAQDAHRMWGRVQTVAGDVHEGFLRWDRNEGSWVDVLDGSKDIPPENYEVWLAANRAGERPVRSIDVRGYRVSWDEEDPDFPLIASSGIRFGHVAQLVVSGDDAVELVLRSGAHLTLSGGSTDMGSSMREFIVDAPGEDVVELEWEDIERVDFFAAPAGARASSRRLYGTVEDIDGRLFSGFLSWDLDEILESDILNGRDEDRDDRDVPFADIRSIEAHRRSSTVTLRSGQTLELSGSNDVSRGQRGVQISDPSLGTIEVEWDELIAVRFTEAPEAPGYEAFDGGHRLVGTLITEAGEELTGRIRWDADEEWSWELLNGRSEDVSFDIEFGRIVRIERDGDWGSRVTLLDGRTFELDDSNDVDLDNKGILVSIESVEGAETPGVAWRYVSWDEFREVRFQHDARPVTSGGPGR